MKRMILFAATCFMTAAAMAQEKADILVSYDVESVNYESDTISRSRMSLLANANESKYFNDISLWNDSLSSTPEGKKKRAEILMAACMTQSPDGGVMLDMRRGPVKTIHTYVFNKVSDKETKYYSKFGDEQGYYIEPFDEIEWEICDSSAVILGYDCVMARTGYHGRGWTAWFAPELPVPFGPWKLRGLPGLILKAEADNGNGFAATGIERSDRVITPIYSEDEYSKVDRKKALADQEYYYDNREAIIQAKHGGKVQFNYNTAERPKYDAAKYALEPDYKK